MKGQFLGLVIIIDDDKDICDLLAHLLDRAGYETHQGYDGSTAIKLLGISKNSFFHDVVECNSLKFMSSNFSKLNY